MVESPREIDITVGTSLTELSSQKDGIVQKRVVITITNSSTGGQILRVATGIDAATGIGRILYPGGSMNDSSESGYQASQLRITAVSSAAGGVATVSERVEVTGL